MKPVLKKTLILFSALFILAACGAIFSSAAAYLYLSPGLPSVESIRDVRLQTPLRVYSSDGKLIGEFGEKRRRPVKLEDVPQDFIDALLAAEDFEFYSHNGVSIRGLLRAVTELIATGERGSGGSTLTMQLTRNVFLSLERKFIRKFNEILLSLKLERELSKDEILELYVNYMFLGKRAYGIQAAAEVYYGKELNELSLAQLAMIAGLFQGPSTQNPIINPPRAIQRRNWILRRMHKLELITDEEFDKAFKETITASYHGNQLEVNAPYVAEMAREKAIRSFGLKAYTDGYRVITTIDSRLQETAQKSIIKGLLAYDQRHGYRGPEQNLANLTSDQLSANDNEEATDTTDSHESWVSILKDIPAYGGLEPVVVTNILETSLIAINKDNEQIQLEWDDGLSKVRRYLSENARGPSPQSVEENFKIGDVIRVIASPEGGYKLSQLPDAQAALVSLDANSGAMLSIVGGFDFYQSHFNRATQAYRQPGSNLKPFVYAAALENGMTAASLINDSPIVLKDAGYEGIWRPKNDGDKFYGPMRLRKALYLSHNMVAIRLLQELGIERTRNALARFGFNPKVLPRDLSLALGNSSVTPLELATAWASFANGGYKVGAHLIQRVYDNNGAIIYEAFPNKICHDCDLPPDDENAQDIELASAINPNAETFDESDFDKELFTLPVKLKRALGWLSAEDYPSAPKVLDDRVAFIMDSILKDVIRKGTGRKARKLQRSDIAGKTGTTNGPTDAWFSGYNRDIITTAWVGFDQNTPLGNREYGGVSALPIWIDFMREALKGRKQVSMAQPEGVISVKIDPETGERARIDNPDAIFEYFRIEQAPELKEQTPSNNGEQPLDIFSEEIF